MWWNAPKCKWKTTITDEILTKMYLPSFCICTLIDFSPSSPSCGHGFCLKGVNFSAAEQARHKDDAHTILCSSHEQSDIRHVLKVREAFIILLLHLPPPHSPCRRHRKVCFHDNKRIKGERGPIQNDTSDLRARKKINHPGWIDRGKWIGFPECGGKKTQKPPTVDLVSKLIPPLKSRLAK